MFNRVVLPHPLRPRSTTNSLSRMERSIAPRTGGTLAESTENDLPTPRMSIADDRDRSSATQASPLEVTLRMWECRLQAILGQRAIRAHVGLFVKKLDE
jgi:hypothetical protein